MLNYNGQLLAASEIHLSTKNRAFNYGDAVFETIKSLGDRLVFFEDHYFRLMASMRMLRMEIPMSFTLEFLESEILKTLTSQELGASCRIRCTVFRKDGGLYAPVTNEVSYLIEAIPYQHIAKESFRVDVYKDFYNYSGLLSTLKTNNRMLNTLASIYQQENELDSCILLNERKGVAETIQGNIFVIKGTHIKTPALSEGCMNGIARKKILEILEKNEHYTVEETVLSPFEIQKADEVFITNSITGVQVVTQYKKKIFASDIGKKIQTSFTLLERTES